MITETISYNGCKILVHVDESPENPFTSWGCEPALLVYSDRHATSYNGAPETLRGVLHILPAETWKRGKRQAFLKEFLSPHFTMREIAEESRRFGCLFDAVDGLLSGQFDSAPLGWRSAQEWFQLAEDMLNFCGVAAVCEESTGDCQGDIALCLAIATPEWLKITGAPQDDTLKGQLEGAIELYGNWAWGRVYGFTLENSEGEEMQGSCWGFYGYDHDKSGLLEAAQGEIDSELAKEAERLATMAEEKHWEAEGARIEAAGFDPETL